MTAGMNDLGDSICCQANLETSCNSDLVWAANSAKTLALCASLALATAGRASLLAAPEVIRVAYFKTLLCRQGKKYLSTNQGTLLWEMVDPASLEVFKSRMSSFPEDIF